MEWLHDKANWTVLDICLSNHEQQQCLLLAAVQKQTNQQMNKTSS